jgi:hypothetical protein
MSCDFLETSIFSAMSLSGDRQHLLTATGLDNTPAMLPIKPERESQCARAVHSIRFDTIGI